VLRDLVETDGTLIDKGLVLWFQAPASFTGESVAEFHLHGGPAVIEAMTECLGSLEGLRPAEPGEFTRQAFANGKIDLTEAEGLADLIAAETAGQRRLALRQMQGALKQRYEGWRAGLIAAGAHLEACIDFADEDIPQDLMAGVNSRVKALASEIRAHLDDSRRGEIIRDGFTIVILGAPNVGKSSLLNALAKRDAAIVSATPGTTRDPIEVHLDLAGYAVTLIDTAGLRDTDDEIENEGIRRARAKAAGADLRLAVCSYSGDGIDSRGTEELSAHDALLLNKADLHANDSHETALFSGQTFRVSARTGEGLDELVRWLESQVTSRIGGSETMPMTRARHRRALEAVSHHLAQFERNGASAAPQLDLLAEDLRMAARELGRITGRIDVEEYLDVIFRDFCIGK
jgi:tRNA modification GTPase